MKDKRLDALLETFYNPRARPPGIMVPYQNPLECRLWRNETTTQHHLCTMESQDSLIYPRTYCQGDIRKCEREE